MTQHKATWKSISEELGQLEEKYFHLVWLARKSPEDYSDPIIAQLMDQVRRDYQIDAMNLTSPIDGDWHHC